MGDLRETWINTQKILTDQSYSSTSQIDHHCSGFIENITKFKNHFILKPHQFLLGAKYKLPCFRLFFWRSLFFWSLSCCRFCNLWRLFFPKIANSTRHNYLMISKKKKKQIFKNVMRFFQFGFTYNNENQNEY